MKKGYLYIILSTFIFSTMEIAGKIANNGLNPFQLNFLRFLIGGLILLLPTIKVIKEKNIKLTKKDLGYFTITGLLGVVISMSLFQLAIVYTKSSTVAVLFSTNPIFTIPFAYFILKENLNKSTIAAIVISLIGIGCILNPFGIKMNRADLIGIILAILAAITFSLYSVLVKMKSEKFGSIVINCLSFLFGDFIMLILMLLSRLPIFNIRVGTKLNSMIYNIPIFKGITSSNILILLYLGIVVTGLGYLLYFLAMDQTSVVMASLVFFVKPALAPILALLILQESIPLNTIFGILFILLGSFVMLKHKKQKSKALELS
ncbi:DMT family transporter [Clostridium fallax]|uniref:EamA domain-containing membrane protein RarD n=1 Tax=Clostridium fallax TaxID=1533 RepID=A0A1M4Z5S6_9CLOT|nr:EamA family transporter [Clostridium fallax]SHF13335.1 EamA domain-containing membrane protein RarD [Clostridium fallax]SQB05883.1 permease [Clostridium fallax]